MRVRVDASGTFWDLLGVVQMLGGGALLAHNDPLVKTSVKSGQNQFTHNTHVHGFTCTLRASSRMTVWRTTFPQLVHRDAAALKVQLEHNLWTKASIVAIPILS